LKLKQYKDVDQQISTTDFPNWLRFVDPNSSLKLPHKWIFLFPKSQQHDCTYSQNILDLLQIELPWRTVKVFKIFHHIPLSNLAIAISTTYSLKNTAQQKKDIHQKLGG
jgi:hypothetical protein